MASKVDKIRANAIVGRMKVYSGLWANPMFQEWKTRVVDARLETWQKDVMSGNPLADPVQVQANILAYQRVKAMFDQFFNEMKETEAFARKIAQEKDS